MNDDDAVIVFLVAGVATVAVDVGLFLDDPSFSLNKSSFRTSNLALLNYIGRFEVTRTRTLMDPKSELLVVIMEPVFIDC